MATARVPESPPLTNHYERQLARERFDVARWPRYARERLDRMEAGFPVVTWGFRVGRPDLRCCWLHPDGSITPAEWKDWLR